MRYDGIPIKTADVIIDLFESMRPQLEVEHKAYLKHRRKTQAQIRRWWKARGY